MKTPRKQKSQIAIIITFVIAVIILLAAVFINIAKVGQIKMSVSQAVDRSALNLASHLGSMSHYYKEVALDGSGAKRVIDGKNVLEVCDVNWKPIIMFVIALGTFIAYFFFPPALLFGALLAFVVNTMMVGAIGKEFQKMTSYNAIREATLFQALASIQADDVQLKAIAPGVFCEDVDNNGACERTYNLSGMPDMLNQPKVDRFSAWYYWNRLTYMREADTETGKVVAKFIYGSEAAVRDGLKKFITIDSTTAWGDINTLSYVLIPGTSGGKDYNVTCSDSCPSWVQNASEDKIRIARLNATGGTYDGFIRDKFIGLLNRLQSAYGSTYCDTCPIRPDDVNSLIVDMGLFLTRTKELINMPVTQRLNNLTEWMPAFYDFKSHKGNRTSIYDKFATPLADFYNNRDDFNEDYSYDIYLRLMRARIYIQSWIPRLEALDTVVKKALALAHGQCTWGRGSGVSSTCASAYGCSTVNCGNHCCGPCDCRCCVKCCNTCCWYKTNTVSPCAWEGIYSTCDRTPAVCGVGDLYSGIPGWCGSHGDHAGCHSSCGCSVNNFSSADPEENFQGQLAWNNTSGPTEIEQALKILRALDADFNFLQMDISDLADKVDGLLTNSSVPGSSGNLSRNQIVYAWTDKRGFSHLAQVKIDRYPARFPYVTERIDWWGLLFCRVLNDYTGEFTITGSRYDQDQPTNVSDWNLRRRKQVDGGELDVGHLTAVVADVQDNAVLNSTEAHVDDILYNHAVMSTATAVYGPEKRDIHITHTEGD